MSAANRQNSIVFIDGGVSEWRDLAASLPAGAEYVVLAPGLDGVAQIAEALEARGGRFSAVHIVSHGDAGEAYLGSGVLSADTLPAHRQDLERISSQLAEGADLLFYGCDVGKGEAGRAFLNELAAITGADVAATQYRRRRKLGMADETDGFDERRLRCRAGDIGERIFECILKLPPASLRQNFSFCQFFAGAARFGVAGIAVEEEAFRFRRTDLVDG